MTKKYLKTSGLLTTHTQVLLLNRPPIVVLRVMYEDAFLDNAHRKVLEHLGREFSAKPTSAAVLALMNLMEEVDEITVSENDANEARDNRSEGEGT